MSKARLPIVSYVRDVRRYANLHPWALLHPRIVKGHFPHKELGTYQKTFFDLLIQNGFWRTRWQVILPGQTAGLRKRIATRPDGTNQFHVRFHEDGSIECEVERHAFDMQHWSGPRYRSTELLEEFLKTCGTHLDDATKERIRSLFVNKWEYCLDGVVRVN